MTAEEYRNCAAMFGTEIDQQQVVQQASGECLESSSRPAKEKAGIIPEINEVRPSSFMVDGSASLGVQSSFPMGGFREYVSPSQDDEAPCDGDGREMFVEERP